MTPSTIANCVLSRDAFQPSRLLPSNSVTQSSAKAEPQQSEIATNAMIEKYRCLLHGQNDGLDGKAFEAPVAKHREVSIRDVVLCSAMHWQPHRR